MSAAPAPLDTCPRCGAALHSDGSWCLSCGLAARTRILAARGWRRPLLAVIGIAAVALVALVLAFVLLTRNDNPVPATTPATTPATNTVAP